MAASPETLYKAHVKNLRAVDTGLQRIFRELNASLARDDDQTADALLKTAMLLLGAWAENRLKKMLFERSGFSASERQLIACEATQIEMWQRALEVGFRRKHRLPKANLQNSLPLTARGQHSALVEIIANDLKPIIEARNKLAHGQ